MEKQRKWTICLNCMDCGNSTTINTKKDLTDNELQNDPCLERWRYAQSEHYCSYHCPTCMRRIKGILKNHDHELGDEQRIVLSGMQRLTVDKLKEHGHYY